MNKQQQQQKQQPQQKKTSTSTNKTKKQQQKQQSNTFKYRAPRIHPLPDRRIFFFLYSFSLALYYFINILQADLLFGYIHITLHLYIYVLPFLNKKNM